MDQLTNLPQLFLGTILLRPYVFVFLAVFLAFSIPWMGRTRTLVFWFGTWILAFLSEFSSTRNGFPYGWYQYTGSTRGQELFVFNVPFMDSLSYSFLLFASFSMALFTVSPLRIQGRKIFLVSTFEIRQRWTTAFLTATYMMMIDVIIDPVALRGERWFLGKIYYYEDHGYYFGIPLSNAFGWFFTGLCAILLFQFLERRFFSRGYQDRGVRILPWISLGGVGLYLGVLAFNLAVTWWIDERALFIAGCFIFTLPVVTLLVRVLDSRNRATDEEWYQYLEDFSKPTTAQNP